MHNAEHHEAPARSMGPRAWLPISFVVGSLVLLLVTPFTTNRRVTYIRTHVVDLANEARVSVSEFEGAFAEELVLASAAPDEYVSTDSARGRAIAQERASERTLDSAVIRIGGKSVRLLSELRAAEGEWRALRPRNESSALPSPVRDRRAAIGRQVIDASEELHQQLVIESNKGRDAVRRLERIDTILSVGLASIALVAVAVVVALERRVRAFAAEADDRARELERSVELRATLINGVVHDVKNPLGAAEGYADLLEEGIAGPMNDRQAEMVGRFKRLIATAQQTVTELVDLARVDAGELTIERRDTNLVTSIRRIVDDHQAQAARKSMTLSFSPPADSLWMQTDSARVRHVIENLLSNALKYTPAGGTIDVALRVVEREGTQRQACISVRDDGPGVPKELRERIFDPFYRVPSSEHGVPGSGLGLAISRRIAGLLGGDLSVTDAPGGGADFMLTLPMDEPQSAVDAEHGVLS
jgi:signal transduction histidine kinase